MNIAQLDHIMDKASEDLSGGGFHLTVHTKGGRVLTGACYVEPGTQMLVIEVETMTEEDMRSKEYTDPVTHYVDIAHIVAVSVVEL